MSYFTLQKRLMGTCVSVLVDAAYEPFNFADLLYFIWLCLHQAAGCASML